MRTKLLLVLLFAANSSFAQTEYVKNASRDAFVITRMAEKFHIKPRALDDNFSSDMFNLLIKSLDREKIYFTKDDLNNLEKYRYQLDDQVRNKETAFLKQVITIYKERLMQVDTMITSICKKPFNLELPEKYTAVEDTTYPANTAAARVKLYKEVKLVMIETMAAEQKDMKIAAGDQKRVNDSMELAIRNKLEKSIKRYIQRHLQAPGGIEAVVSEKYCNAVACCYDPHSEFMSLTTREVFEGQLGKKKLAFGFSLDEDAGGNVVIKDLKPGSPAFQSGQINAGDKIMSVQWGSSKPIDLSGAGLDEIAGVLDQSNHEKALLTIKKADGTTRQLSLTKEEDKNDNEDDEKVKSFVLKGAKTIGYISLPTFYEDWEHKVNINGCANDVAKEIMKLKKENIEGLIMDLRYNGGGSLQEAVELAGIFIDAGPVAIEKDKGEKVFTWKDTNRGTVYDGPMVVMVNGYTASASELFAGCLQDYNRAAIVGSPTYGKGTGQGVLPMDTTITLERDISNMQPESYLKLTILEIYRVSGNTAQFKGVTPDILLPDATEIKRDKEKDEPFAITPAAIEANKYYKPERALVLQPLKDMASDIVKTDPYFKSVQERITARREGAKKDISLRLSDHLKSTEDEEDTDEADVKEKPASPLFSIEYNAYEQERVKGNTELKEMYDVWITFLKKDPYLKTAFKLIGLMK
jgi:carboxyl-terminal processing protease